MEEQHQLPQPPLGAERARKAEGPFFAHPLDLAQLLGRTLDHVEDPLPEGVDEAPRELGSNTRDRARSEVALDTVAGGRG